MKSNPIYTCDELGVCKGSDPACVGCSNKQAAKEVVIVHGSVKQRLMKNKVVWIAIALYIAALAMVQHFDTVAENHEQILLAKRQAFAAGRAQGLADAAQTLGSGTGLAKACTTWWFGGDAKRANTAIQATCKSGDKS